MAIRVAQIGTGNVGRHALTQLITDPRVRADRRVGVVGRPRPARTPPSSPGSTTDGHHRHQRPRRRAGDRSPNAPSTPRWPTTGCPRRCEDYRRILAAGVNVVGSSAVFLQYPWQVLPDEMIAADRGGRRRRATRVFSSTASTPASPTTCCRWRSPGTCQSIEQIRCMEIINYATYDSATVMFDVMGFGRPLDEMPLLLQPGVLSLAWGSVVRQLAAGLGVELDGVDRDVHARARTRGLRHRLRTHREGHRRGAAVRGARHERRHGRRRARTRDPTARRPAPGLAAARAGGRLLPDRGDRRTDLHGGPAASSSRTATTTTPAWWPPRRAWSTRSPPWWPRARASGPPWTCPWSPEKGCTLADNSGIT